MKKKVNGVQKKVVEALRNKGILSWFGQDSRPVKSHKQLQEELDEPGSNISYATQKLKEKDLIKDTEVLEGDKTAFKLRKGIKTTKKYDFESIINNTVVVHAISVIGILVYPSIAPRVTVEYGAYTTIFVAGLIGLLPSFLYNLYQIASSLDTYKLVVEVPDE